MASPWLQLVVNPHNLATLLLSIAVCLATVSTFPTSSHIYILRADFSTASGNAIATTAWFSSLGYCTTYANNGPIAYTHLNNQCTFSPTGYNVQEALEQDGTTIVPIPEASVFSAFLTRGAAILNILAIALCHVGMVAHQLLITRATPMRYAVSLGGSLLALLLSGVTCIFVHSLSAYIASGDPATGAAFTTTSGPLVYTTTLSLLCQLAACVVGFYSCIGGKYRCEGGIVLRDGENLNSNGQPFSLNEKCSLEISPSS